MPIWGPFYDVIRHSAFSWLPLVAFCSLWVRKSNHDVNEATFQTDAEKHLYYESYYITIHFLMKYQALQDHAPLYSNLIKSTLYISTNSKQFKSPQLTIYRKMFVWKYCYDATVKLEGYSLVWNVVLGKKCGYRKVFPMCETCFGFPPPPVKLSFDCQVYPRYTFDTQKKKIAVDIKEINFVKDLISLILWESKIKCSKMVKFSCLINRGHVKIDQK